MTQLPPPFAVTQVFGFCTVRLAAAVWLKLPLVPVMISVELPAGVELVVETVRVEDPEPLTDVGLKLAVAPAGKPLAAKVTLPLKPFSAVIVAL